MTADRLAASWRAVLRLSRRHPVIISVLGLAALLIALFPGLILNGRVLYERDIHLFWWTQVQSFVRVVTTPAWPVWDPYSSFGQPLLADTGAEVLYPPTWLNLLMEPGTYYRWFVIGHLLFTAMGMRALARRFRISRCGAFVAGAAWMLSGPMLSLANAWHHFAGAAWIPWVLWGAEQVCVRRRARDIILLALLAAGQALAGSPDMCVLSSLGAFALVVRRITRTNLTAGLAGGARLGASAILAAGLTAALWLPALGVLRGSARADLSDRVRTYWSVHPVRLATTVLPFTRGQLPISPALRREISEGREPFLYSLYLGLPAVALVVTGIALRRRRDSLALAALSAAICIAAMGRHTPLYDFLSSVVVPLRALRYPEKLMVLVAVCWAVLVGLGLDVIARRRSRGPGRWLPSAVLAVLTVGAWGLCAVILTHPGSARPPWLAGGVEGAALRLETGRALALAASLTVGALVATMARRQWSAWVLGAVVLVDLVAAHRGLHETAPAELFRYVPPAASALAASPTTRLFVWDYARWQQSRSLLGRDDPYAPRAGPRGWTRAEANALVMRQALVPPTANGWGLATAFEFDYKRLNPQPLARLTQLLRRADDEQARLRLLQLGAVDRAVTLHTQGLDRLEIEAELPTNGFDPVRVWKVPLPLPRVHAVSAAWIVSDDMRAGRLLASGAIDPWHDVVLATGTPSTRVEGFRGRATLVQEQPDRLLIDTRLSDPGYLVVADTFDPGWRASVDGHPARLLRANVAFRAVRLPAGSHRVEMRYRPRALLLGIALSLLAALALGAPATMHALRTRCRPG